MKFEVFTLVDITETKARRGEDPKEVKQQQNYMTFIQTLGLRINFRDITSPKVIKDDVKNYEFGSKFTGKQNVWRIAFDPEREDSILLEHLINDFDIVPIISNLDETVDLKTNAFRSSKSEETNIIFRINDK